MILTSTATNVCTQVVHQLYKIVGSVDFLGNPIGVASQIGTGLKDFFYEPGKAILSDPQHAYKAFARGAASLVTNTTTAVFDASSKMTGALAKSLARLTDDEFMQVSFLGVF